MPVMPSELIWGVVYEKPNQCDLLLSILDLDLEFGDKFGVDR